MIILLGGWVRKQVITHWKGRSFSFFFLPCLPLPIRHRHVPCAASILCAAFQPGIHGPDRGGALPARPDPRGVQRPSPSERDLHGPEQVIGKNKKIKTAQTRLNHPRWSTCRIQAWPIFFNVSQVASLKWAKCESRFTGLKAFLAS